MSPTEKGLTTVGQLVAKHGIATVIAAVLVGWLVARIDGKVAETNAIVANTYHALTEHVKSEDESARALQRLMQQICINTAKDDQQRSGCLR